MTLTFTPRAVNSSNARTPAAVAGTLLITAPRSHPRSPSARRHACAACSGRQLGSQRDRVFLHCEGDPIASSRRYLHYVPAHDDAARLTAAFTVQVGTETGTELPTGTRN